MHETMIAQNLYEAIAAEVQNQNGKVLAAKVSCGSFHIINDEVLKFAFKAIARGTPYENTELQIEHKPMQAKCKKCQKTFEVKFEKTKCPVCGSEQFELMTDTSLLLEEIEIEKE